MSQVIPNSVLIVDDEPMVRDLLREILKDLGYTVMGSASNGQLALDKAKEQTPEIVCLDINMPEVSGLDALAGLKTVSTDIIVIMITAVNDASGVQQALRTGADGYLLKPFTGQQIHKAILKARQKRDAKQKLQPPK